MRRQTLGLLLGLVALVVLDLAVLPLLGGRALLDTLLLAVVAVAVRVRPGVAAVTGFALGILRDATAPDAFGASALALSLVGYAVARLSAGAFEERAAATAATLVVARLVAEVVFVLAEGRMQGMALLLRFIWWAPLGALVTTIVGVPVLRLLPAPSDRRRGR